MRDMNDVYVNERCQTRVHIGGYVFTIAELYTNAINTMNSTDLAKHENTESLNN